MKEWILGRLKERSTWVSILALCGYFGVKITPEFQNLIVEGIGLIVAGIFIATKDQNPVTISKPSMDEIKAGVPELIKTVMQPDTTPGKNLDP